MSGTAFRDFIPAGEDTGAQGSGFQDFVPAAKPQFHPEVEAEVVVETPVEEVEEAPKKGKK